MNWIMDRVRMSGKRFRSIGFKLFLAFLVSIVVSCAVTGWLSYSISASAIQDKVGNNAGQVTQATAKNVDLWEKQIEGIFNSVVFFATNNSSLSDKRIKLLPTTPADQAAYQDALDQITVLNDKLAKLTADLKPGSPKTIEITKTESDISTLTSTTKTLNKAKTDADKAFQDYLTNTTLTNSDRVYSAALIRYSGEQQSFVAQSPKMKLEPYKLTFADQAVKAKGQAVFLPPQEGSYLYDSTERVFGFAKAFWSPDEKVWADVIVVEFKLSYFENMLRPITFGGIGEVHLIDSDGKTIFSNREGITLGAESEAAKGLTEDGSPKIVKQSNGKNYLTVGTKLNNQPWVLSGTIEESKLLSDAKKIQTRIFILIGCSLIAALLLGWWCYATIGKPLLTAQQKMQQAENGDLSVRLQFKRADEIGSVGTSFDRMMEKISGIVENTGASANHLFHSTERIRELVIQNESASKEIATAIDEVAKGAADLANDAERSNTITGQLHQALDDVKEKNTVMQQVSEQMEAVSQDGLSAMKDLTDQSREVEAKVRELNQKIDQLKSSTDAISVVLVLLQGISKKINILSLNASIVAASSGEAGKSFVVVANEIRNLAAQSQQSIDSVGEVIARIQDDMRVTNELVNQAMPIFSRQLSTSEASQDIFRKISSSMQEFSNRFREVWNSLQVSMASGQELNSVLLQVSAVSEEFTASTEDVAILVNKQYASSNQMVETGKELEQLSVKLRESLSGFNLQAAESEAAAPQEEPEVQLQLEDRSDSQLGVEV